MRSYILSENDMERLVQDAVKAYRENRVDVSTVHPHSRARTFRRSVIRNYIEMETPITLISDGDIKLSL